MSVAAPSPVFNDPDLHRHIMEFREVDNVTNLAHLAREYLGIAAVMAVAVGFCEWVGARGLNWSWDIPVVALAVVLIGGLQHRLAGLGHEASHFTLLRHKLFNEVVGDLLCMFPILATTRLYRQFHMAHHRYTNDPERDPDMVSLGRSRLVDQFPMSTWRFVRLFYLRPLLDPWSFLRYQVEYMGLNVAGTSTRPGLATKLAWAYVMAFVAGLGAAGMVGRPDLFAWLGLGGVTVVAAVGAVLPAGAFAASPLRQPLSARVAGVMRLGYYTACLASLGAVGVATDGKSSLYFLLLWGVPQTTTFFYFMLLRDAYQHTNADDGRLTNTRVFVPDPFTRWAVFIYGQDMHVPHHLFPGIPHYHLPRLHQLLKERHAAYAANVVECHGTFVNRKGLPTILGTLTNPVAPKASSTD